MCISMKDASESDLAAIATQFAGAAAGEVAGEETGAAAVDPAARGEAAGA